MYLRFSQRCNAQGAALFCYVRLRDGCLDAVDSEGVAVVEQVAAGMGDVGATSQAQRADGQVTEDR